MIRWLAHEKWFVPESIPMMEKPLIFREWSSTNASLALFAVFAFVAVLLIHSALKSHKLTRRIAGTLGAYKNWMPPVLRVATGALLFVGGLSNFLFAPDLAITTTATFARVLLAAEIFSGLGLMLGVFPRLMSLMGFTIYFVALFLFPVSSMLAYFFFPGIFAYFFLAGDPSLPRVRGGAKFFPNIIELFGLGRAVPYAFTVLRICTGAAFIWAGWYYKILSPSYALQFLSMHNVNFMHGMGFMNFGNDFFVLSTGAMEILLGMFIVFGLLPRLVGALLIALFTVTMMKFGIQELVGHLPLYAVAFALLIYGASGGASRRSRALSKQ